ncbi:MAG: 50S ribosomal protein L10 [Victivallaceae bacterium]|nr:50S ribosomal protein L10 [Victivallaceae bacterium]
MRSEKLHLVSYIGSLISDSDYVYFITYAGLTVKEISQLRRDLLALGASCHVLKNTLIKKAAELQKIDALLACNLTGGTALVSGKGDASEIAKVLAKFGKSNEKVAAKCGYFEGTLLSASDVKAIADLPAKPVLQAQLLGVLQAVPRNFVSVLNAKAASILNVLNAYQDKKEKSN